jgi:hypothetical protein
MLAKGKDEERKGGSSGPHRFEHVHVLLVLFNLCFVRAHARFAKL